MIEYVEIRDEATRTIEGIVDYFNSVLWVSRYYGTGEFEIYTQASEKHLELLQVGKYVTRPNNKEIGKIENIEITYSTQDGLMIAASGRSAKSILDRRHIYKLSGNTNQPTILTGKVEVAIRKVITDNAIDCYFDTSRNIPELTLGELKGIPAIITGQDGQASRKQVSFRNLLDYTDSVLAEYRLGSTVELDITTGQLLYAIIQGENRSIDNTAGNEPVIFSVEFDNLTESNYSFSTASSKTAALIGGEGEGLERFYSLIAGTEMGINRKETFLDASSISKSYDEGQSYLDVEYDKILKSYGKQELARLVNVETLDGQLNVTGGLWRLNQDYYLGDIITVQDNNIQKYINARITEITECQDLNGYQVEIIYLNEGSN